jgi:superfamily I DNA/RNA helicase
LTTSLAPAERVLLLTFSNQARTQLESEAARQLTRDQRHLVEITNYHRLFWRAVNAYRRVLGLPDSVRVVPDRVRANALAGAIGVSTTRDLAKSAGLLEELAEHRFEAFCDERTPSPEIRNRAFEVIEAEQRAGRLVFGDFGALFWALLDRPAIGSAYAARFPTVIADEHQDASELQDAVVRRLGSRRLFIFADPMQLIHEFRGATEQRLHRHLYESGEDGTHRLRVPHRWDDDVAAGKWLLAVRERLEGTAVTVQAPSRLRTRSTVPVRGRPAMVTSARYEVRRLRRLGLDSVAVFARDAPFVELIRDSFCRKNVFPRHVGGGDAFEEAFNDIDLLSSGPPAAEIAQRAVARVAALAPGFDRALHKQLQRRTLDERIDFAGCGLRARPLLEALQLIYDSGGVGYFHALSRCLDVVRAYGFHVPQRDALRAIKETADDLDSHVGDTSLDAVVSVYQERFLETQHAAPRTDRGVFVMTAHQSKGKEFDAIVLVGADRASFPDDAASRKLLYVVLTRATRAWVAIHPEGAASPLLALC